MSTVSALTKRYRRIYQTAGDGKFVYTVGNGLDSRISHCYGTADDGCCFQRLTSSIGFSPVSCRVIPITDIESRVKRPFDLSPVHAHVASAGVRVLGNPASGREIRRVVKAWSRYRNRKFFQPTVFEQIFSCMNDFLDFSRVNQMSVQ